MDHPLSHQQIAELKEFFDSYDDDKSGTITAVELGKLMRAIGIDLTEAELYDVIDDVDKDGNREIDFGEFLKMMAPKIQFTESDANLREAFKVFDSDGDGFFVAADIRAVVSSLGEVATDADIKEIINEMDSTGDRAIDLREFIKFMRSE